MGLLLRSRCCFREQNDERSAFVGFADHMNGSGMAIHNAFADGESHTRSLKHLTAMGPFKGMKDQIDQLGFNTDAIVLDHDFPESVTQWTAADLHYRWRRLAGDI